MSFIDKQIFKVKTVAPRIVQFIPPIIRPPLRKLKLMLTSTDQSRRMEYELRLFSAAKNIHQLPSISDHWFQKHISPALEPFGFRTSIELMRTYIARMCKAAPSKTCRILTIAAGECAPEINIAEWLRENSIENFHFECLDVNQDVLLRAQQSAASKGFVAEFEFRRVDMNGWTPTHSYDVILAIQCLHHLTNLEDIFETIHQALDPAGFFITDDMIGRNGHKRWPEAKIHVDTFWKELPDRYKYNHAFQTQDLVPDDRDFSVDCFEGIRSQDILKLLVKRFHFEFFLGFANVIDVFVDRLYGPNFDPDADWDRDFIDRVHALDVNEIDSGRIKPTHMYAAMTKDLPYRPKFYKHWSPEFCIRHT
jgi:SAM-dependent methyltransferase